MEPLRAHGFHPYRLINDSDPAAYPAALRRPAAPQRLVKPFDNMNDLIFSRTDAAELAATRGAALPSRLADAAEL